MKWRYLLLLCLVVCRCRAQESPFFVTYDHHLEEPGNLEIETSSSMGVPRSGQHFYFAPYTEFEYGVTGRWTSELYLEGQSTAGDSTIFTGWRLENRFRPLKREHRINPVLYLEYESLNEGSRIQKEIVGNSLELNESNSELRRVHAHELETKLILSSQVHDWNIAENFIVEKNLSASEGFEFGYAFGVSRPLATIASATECRWCRENFAAGVEMYGGLGSSNGFGLHDTSHYVAPVVIWQFSDNASLRFSPAIGLTHGSNPVLFRFGYSYEVRGFGTRLSHWLGGRP
ncbi:MAG TPA: hypothetical protein VFA68_18980 [Terriglobales bacterium]|nr:hypothetical protein [Terriglobales bacterium]